MSEQQQPPNARISAALWNIRIDAAIVEVVEKLGAAAIDSLVLKGPALAELYEDVGDRRYVDGDVWVAPGDLEAAGDVLKTLGFVP